MAAAAGLRVLLAGTSGGRPGPPTRGPPQVPGAGRVCPGRGRGGPRGLRRFSRGAAAALSAGKVGRRGGGCGAVPAPAAGRRGRPSPSLLPARRLSLVFPAAGEGQRGGAMGARAAAWVPWCLLSAALAAAAAASGESPARGGPCPEEKPSSPAEEPPSHRWGFGAASPAFPLLLAGRGSAARPPPFWRPLHAPGEGQRREAVRAPSQLCPVPPVPPAVPARRHAWGGGSRLAGGERRG